jgi:hypothetical protein
VLQICGLSRLNMIEITGQACAGKTRYIRRRIGEEDHVVLAGGGRLNKLFYFASGFKYLGLSRVARLYLWSLDESAPYYFRLNIFINAVSKFGLIAIAETSELSSHQIFLRDEGISHLPFLFLNTDTELVVDFIRSEIKNVEIYFLKSPGCRVIQDRLANRGHKRLQFISLTFFVQRNDEIEKTLLNVYPNSCRNIEVL